MTVPPPSANRLRLFIVSLGLVIIVASGQGNTVTFDGIIPTIVPKE